MFPWPRSTHDFDYDGLCSHSSFCEGDIESLGLSAEDLKAAADVIKEKNRLYGLEYARKLRANPTDKYIAGQQANRLKQAPTTRQRQREAVATKKYHCDVCNVSCRDMASLVRHNKTPRHDKKTRMGDADYECLFCNKSFRYKSDYTLHCTAKSHIRNESLQKN
jgi:hypothetical protein